MYPAGGRRRKKRPMHCIKTVEVARGKSGYGFTISGEEPCILSCIVHGSPADRAGLRTGDFLMNVNGLNVASAAHDDVVRLIGSSSGVLVLQIAENPAAHSSDSSDTELHARPKSKYQTRRGHRARRDEMAGDRRETISHKYGGHVVLPDTSSGSKVRGLSPSNREVAAYFHEHDPHHRHVQQTRAFGIENVNPYGSDAYGHKRSKHTSGGMQKSTSAAPVAKRQTKHTIITREHRLGLTKSASISDSFGVRHLLPPQPLVSDPLGHARNNSTSSSSSANTYLPMGGGRLTQSQRDVRHFDVDAEHADVDNTSDVTDDAGNLRAVVGYVGSLEMPRETRLNSRLQSIRSAVRRLQVERKVHTLVLMVITCEGVTLVNTMGNTVAIYPAHKVAFSGVNSDDKRFFGIVTSQGAGEIVSDNDGSLGGSCHVFMVDPELSIHSVHASKAKLFGIQCTLIADASRCREFPKAATVIVTCISRLYHDRQGGSAYESGMAHLSAFAQPVQHAAAAMPQRNDSTNSSNSDSGLGLAAADTQGSNAQVCVVEMGQGLREMNQSAASMLPNANESNPEDSSNNSSTLRNSAFDSEDISESSLPWAASGDSLKLLNSSVASNRMNQSQNTSIISQSQSILSNQGQAPANIDVQHKKDSKQIETEISDKFTIRAMPNPKGILSGSWKTLLEDQNSAENLRKSMKKFLSATTKANETHSDAESVNSLDLALEQGRSQGIEGHSGVTAMDDDSPHKADMDLSPPTPPLPPRNLRGSGPGRNAFQPVIINAQNQNPQNERMLTPLESRSSAKPTLSANTGGKMLDMDRKQMPPPAPLIATYQPTTKPPVPPPSILRTPQHRPQVERPKSTPPMRSRPSEIDMDVDEENADFSSFADTLDVTSDMARIRAEVRASGDGPGVLGRRIQKQQDRAGNPRSSLSATQKGAKLSSSHESLVVNNNDAEAVGARLGEGATSVTVITANGVVSYGASGGVPIGRVAGWAVNFDRLMRDTIGLATFTEFLKKVFADENIVFWKKCEQYRKLTDEQERRKLAVDIHKHHVSANASEAVNIDSLCVSMLTEEAIHTATPELFDLARKQIFQLMKQDSYPRFVKSELYKESVRCELDGRPLPFGDGEGAPTPLQQADSISTGSRDSIGKKSSKFLKKSQSGGMGEDGIDGKRRRSLLPWGKKDKSKLTTKSSDSDLTSSRKSNTFGKKTVDTGSLHQLRHLANGDTGRSKDDMFTAVAAAGAEEGSQKFVRVALPDGSTTMIYAKPSTTVRAAIAKLCERRNLSLHMVDVYSANTLKIVDMSRDVSKLGTREIILEPRIVFRLDLPNSKSLGVKAMGHTAVKQALAPVLLKYGYRPEAYVLHEVGSSSVLEADTRVSDIQNKRIAIFPADQYAETNQAKKKKKEWGGLGSNRGNKPAMTRAASVPFKMGYGLSSDASVEQLFADLFNGDAQLHAKFDSEGLLDFDKKEEKTTKEENRVSGIFSNLLRKNSMDGKDGGKVKAKRGQGSQKLSSKPDHSALPPRMRNDKEDMKVFALLSKVSSQFDDQRGPLRKQDLELPDFLKPAKTSEGALGSGNEYPSLRKTEMHSSDTSLYEPPSIAGDSRSFTKALTTRGLELTRTLSNSEEQVDNLLMKQFRGSFSRNKGGYSIHSSFSTAMQPQPHTQASAVSGDDATTPSKFPYMDASFASTDGVVPSHNDAEHLFHDAVGMGHQSGSPDFNKSGLMERSRVDFGGPNVLSEHNRLQASSDRDSREGKGDSQHQERTRSNDVNDARSKSVYRELIPPAVDGLAHKTTPLSPSYKYKRRQRPTDGTTPVPAPRRSHSARHLSPRSANADVESVSSEGSQATQSDRYSTNSSDLDHTLLPLSDESDAAGGQDSSKNSALPTTPKGVLNLDPARQKFYPAPLRSSEKQTRAMPSPSLQRPLKEQSISWTTLQSQRTSPHPPQSPLPHASYRGQPLPVSQSRGSTPSPSTHDLIFSPESSADENSSGNTSGSGPVPAPRRRRSRVRDQNGANSSLENVLERGREVQKTHKMKKLLNGGENEEEGEEVQVSYV